MTRFPLHLLGWSYDDETNRVVVSFQEGPQESEPDPASFRPQRFFSVELVPESAESEVRPLPTPPPPPPTVET